MKKMQSLEKKSKQQNLNRLFNFYFIQEENDAYVSGLQLNRQNY